ncbi:B-cell receptor CD22-like [Haliotis rufescens]|uniref:B-cell receptor CD22-like n=1 Tax=Haliotis rufescens TaxID=6454 RepID=UPI00201E834A|nr:B-cell receptor CD22-like [Haliotis rufescens]
MLKSGFTAARLVSTTKQPAQGTLELYYKQQWGRVCNSGFNVKEATVVCRMLGYLAKHSSVIPVNVTSPRPMVLDRVQCLGTEPSLNECLHYPWNDTSCSSTSAVGIKCSMECNQIHLEPTGNLLNVPRGQDISVKCVVDSSTTTPPVSPFIWIYNTQYYSGQVFRKTITSKSDSGNLTCSFKNKRASTYINVLYPPRIHLEPDTVEVAVGGDVHVLCVVDDANPSVTTFTWLHNGLLTTGATFTALNVSKSDRGELYCYADNGQKGMTPVRAVMTINVKYPPEIHLEPRQDRINVLRGGDVTVVCVVDAANPAVFLFMWNHNNDITYGQTFTKNNVSKSDTGRLYCTADNGEVTASVGSQIVVVYPPEIHLEPSVEVLSVLPGVDVTVVCVVDDANPAVSSFTWNHNGNVTCGQNYTKQNVSKFDPGSLSCTAANDEGNTTIRTTIAVVSVGRTSVSSAQTPTLVVVAGSVAAVLILVLVIEILHLILKLNTTEDQRLKDSESKRTFRRIKVKRQHNHLTLPVPESESRHVYTTVGLNLPDTDAQTANL